MISSTRNQRIRDAAALKRRRSREQTQRYLVEGPRYVADLLDEGDLEEIFATSSEAEPLAETAATAGVTLTVVTEEVLDHLADSVTPQGVVAVARQRRAALEDVLGGGHLAVLCQVSDPGNAGTAVRTVATSGAAGIVLTRGSVDPWNPKAVRASAGSTGRLPIVVDVDEGEVLRACAEVGQRRIALDASGGIPIDRPGVLEPPVALFFGSEAHGLPEVVLESADDVVAIPSYRPVESLNLAAAVAVAVFVAAGAAQQQRIERG